MMGDGAVVGGYESVDPLHSSLVGLERVRIFTTMSQKVLPGWVPLWACTRGNQDTVVFLCVH